MNTLLEHLCGRIYHPFLYRIRNRKQINQLNKLFLSSKKNYDLHKIEIPKNRIDEPVSSRTAIQIHVFYVDLLKEFYNHLKFITIPYDLFISTDSNSKKSEIESFFKKNELHANAIKIEVFENIGRDVYPFLEQLKSIYKNYEYIAHFHTKKTLDESFGDKWRKSLLNSCIGKESHFDNIIKILEEDKNIGLILPSIPNISHVKRGYISTKLDEWNCSNLPRLLKKIGIKVDANFKLLDSEHPAGNMFVARTNAVRQIFNADFSDFKFPSEKGQKSHTLQHLIELIWQPLCEYNGYDFKTVL